MLKTEILPGHVYRYQASTGRRFDVRIRSRSPLLRAWLATDLSNNKAMLIRQPWRVKYEVVVEREPRDIKQRAAGD